MAAEGKEPGTVLGTVGHMAPEQVRGRVDGHRGDIFAMGTVLFKVLPVERS